MKRSFKKYFLAKILFLRAKPLADQISTIRATPYKFLRERIFHYKSMLFTLGILCQGKCEI